jgi:hypothetical protein
MIIGIAPAGEFPRWKFPYALETDTHLNIIWFV